MKSIVINEKQYQMLVNLIEGGVPDYDNGDVKEHPGSEVSTTAVVHDSDGDPKYGKMPTTDEISNELTPQGWMASQRYGRGPMF